MTAHPTLKALLRDALGEGDYKNLENRAKGRCGSARIDERLQTKLAPLTGSGVNLDVVLDALEASLRGELNEPSGQQLALMVEGALVRIAVGLSVRTNWNASDARWANAHADRWWALHQAPLGAPEAAFVDRLLFGVVGRTLLSASGVPSCSSACDLRALLDAGKGRPFANWLEVVRSSLGAGYLKDVPARASSGVSADKLFRINQGDMLTQHVCANLLAGVRKNDEALARKLEALAVDARYLALATDFVCAAQLGGDELTDQSAFALVVHRLGMLARGMPSLPAWPASQSESS